ncbi:MAG: hypothetical protein ACFE85_12760 [Candidatus Hodarchaeota archaeon]
MSEELDRFLKFLNYQIDQKNRFENVVRKIPLFKNKIEESHYTILKMIDINRREIYKMLLKEFNVLT